MARLDEPMAGVFTAVMRKVLGVWVAAVLFCGCASHKAPGHAPDSSTGKPVKPIVTPDFRPVGKVAMVNETARFVVLSYTPGFLPKSETPLAIFHEGLKAGKVLVTGPAIDNNTIAEIVAGSVSVGDEARQE